MPKMSRGSTDDGLASGSSTRHQGLGHVAHEVRLTVLFRRKGVEDTERRRRELQSEPDRRSRLLVCQLEAGSKELRYRLFFARLGFKSDERSTFDQCLF